MKQMTESRGKTKSFTGLHKWSGNEGQEPIQCTKELEVTNLILQVNTA